jgi:uncharacterized protein
MTIPGADHAHFLKIIGEYLSPSRPVSHHEHLMGRDDMLLKIERAFSSGGRHIFIHGDRGIGKTSLARSAGLFHQHASLPLLTVQCEPTADAYSLMHDMALKILPSGNGPNRCATKERFNIGIPGLSYEKIKELSAGGIPKIESINEALGIIDAISRLYDVPPVVIIDEFDQIASLDSRRTIASFFKAVSDQEIPLRFIICGIGDSLDAMIGEHMSTGRLLAPLRLEAISLDARFKILEAAATEIGVQIDRETLIRTALISDGFPYYVHLIGEQLFWSMYDDPSEVRVSAPEHFDNALRQASEMAEPNLKHSYEKAIQKYKNDYEEVLWSVADHSNLQRQVTEIYDRSYTRIMELRGKAPLSKKTFNSRLSMLCNPRHGPVLEATGAGWYKFKENRLRGYIRLVAERNGVKLASEHHFGNGRRIVAD